MTRLTSVLFAALLAVAGCGSAQASHSSGGSTSKTTLEVSSLTCAQLSFTGAGTDVCTVTLSSVVTSPGGKSVGIGSSNSAITVPASVVVAKNQSSASFSISVAEVSSSMVVNVTATLKTTASVAITLNAVAPPPPPTSYTVNLTWDPPTVSADPVAGYDVYRSSDGGATYAVLNSAPTSLTSFADATVQSGASYQYYVTSVDAQGNQSVPSNVWSTTIP